MAEILLETVVGSAVRDLVPYCPQGVLSGTSEPGSVECAEVTDWQNPNSYEGLFADTTEGSHSIAYGISKEL